MHIETNVYRFCQHIVITLALIKYVIRQISACTLVFAAFQKELHNSRRFYLFVVLHQSYKINRPNLEDN